MGKASASNHDGQPALPDFDALINRAPERFANSKDFTVGIEEEFALLDPESLDLTPEFDRVHNAALEAGLGALVAGELLASEIEFMTSPCATWADVSHELIELRGTVADIIRSVGLVCATGGTHPWADYREQEIIDAPYYAKLVDRMQYVARRNNTFGLHIHVGVQGGDRAVRVATALRDYQHLMLALSGSSPFLDGVDTGLCSARSMVFSRNFPRGNIAPAFATLEEYRSYLTYLRDVGSIFTPNQVWWGARPHIRHGTVEFRMFDAQPDVRDSAAFAAFALGLVADLVEQYDAGELPDVQPDHLVDENLWRALRFGTDAEFIELPHARTCHARDAIESALDRARNAGARAGLDIGEGLDRVQEMTDRGSPALWMRARAQDAGGDLRAAWQQVVETTMSPAEIHRS